MWSRIIDRRELHRWREVRRPVEGWPQSLSEYESLSALSRLRKEPLKKSSMAIPRAHIVMGIVCSTNQSEKN